MASSAVATARSSVPLSFMQKLSDAVFLYRPTKPTAAREASSASAPKLVLVLAWMDAREQHLARYVRQYQALYPASAVLLVKSSLLSLSFANVGFRNAAPAVAPIREILGDGGLGHPRLFIHAFSGGGSCALYHLYEHFSQLGLAVPPHKTVFDSTPGVWSYAFHVNVLMVPVKSIWMRLFVLPIVHLLAAASWFSLRVLGLPDNQQTWSTAHNDPSKVKETRRAYIYGDSDNITLPAATEAHAADAKAKGFDVRLECFKDSGHVAHMMTDTDRYWEIIRETWEEA